MLYDAVAILVSADGAKLLSQEATAKDFISDAFAHGAADLVVHNDLAARIGAGGNFPATIWRPDGSVMACCPTRPELAVALRLKAGAVESWSAKGSKVIVWSLAAGVRDTTTVPANVCAAKAALPSH